MGDKTKIEWAEATWNPVAGCSIVSPGCTNCYAMRQTARNGAAQPQGHYAGLTRQSGGRPVWTGRVALAPNHILYQPLRWSKPRMIFVNSMSDLFHEDMPDEWRDQAFAIMALADHHIYQVLTKRPHIMRDYLSGHSSLQPLAPHIWLGVSVENADHMDRIDILRDTPTGGPRFLSLEPLLGPLPDLNLDGIDWVIVGGESGPRHRPVEADWVRDIRDQCIAAGVAFFFKQWGGHTPKAGGHLLDGEEWHQMPDRGA